MVAAETLMKVTWDESADPAVLEAFSTIEKFPAPKVWAGSGNVLNQISVLLPVTFRYDQFHAVGVFEEVSVKVTAKGAVPDVALGVKLATGAMVAAGIAYAQFPIMDRVADKVVQKYQGMSCEQLWAQKSQPKSEEEQRVIGFLKSDPQMRQAFVNKVAGPIVNKMFECGMVP
jgi:hypothetical protein